MNIPTLPGAIAERAPPRDPATVATLARPDYRLADSLAATRGTVFLTGVQALVRLPLMQAALDRARGLETAGFVSGYRGSPLGGYDLALWKAQALLDTAHIEFLPAINEELAGTAVLGSQQVETDAERTVAGVFALWYGKGPGTDRAGDALKHGNAYGASPHGGVLVVAGDDHGCVSSSMPHQCDVAMQSWSMPLLHPGNVAEYLEFGLYGWALSRFSGNWVGFKAISEIVESGMTVDLDAVRTDFPPPPDFAPPPGGLHYRWPDLPSLVIEQRLAAKLDAVRAFAAANSIDRAICAAPHADLGIVTCGKAHFDFLEVLRRLGLTLTELQGIGAEVGIPPDRIAAAANAVGTRAVPARKPKMLLGTPRSVSRIVPIERSLNDAEWDRLVADLRHRFVTRPQASAAVRHIPGSARWCDRSGRNHSRRRWEYLRH